MASCCKCGNQNEDRTELDYQDDLYYYWDSPLEEDYDWRTHQPNLDCLCEICFDILNLEGKIIWKDNKNPFKQPV